MAFSGTQTTRLGLYGGARGLYGSFAGRIEAVVEIVAEGSLSIVTGMTQGRESLITDSVGSLSTMKDTASSISIVTGMTQGVSSTITDSVGTFSRIRP